MAVRKPASRPLERRVWLVVFTVIAVAMTLNAGLDARAKQGRNVFGLDADAESNNGSEPEEPAVFLTNDRVRERLLDRAKRLAADGRWSDAAAACDEILADEQDAFVDGVGDSEALGSIRSQAAAIVAGFPRPGRDAYQLLFRARAEKRLAEAVASDDRDSVVAVARRWFGTPAGRHAAMITATVALEEGQPLVAAMWLDRLASSDEAQVFEPSLSLMRAIARRHTGDEPSAQAMLRAAAATGRVARIAGRDLLLSSGSGGVPSGLDELVRIAPPGGASKQRGDWLQVRGGPSRNTVVDASKPLLVPRYRVPLVRHPDEARRLERRRSAAADAGTPLVPAGSPLAVGDSIVVHTPLGILAVDFETGKRIWLESSVAPEEPDEVPEGPRNASGRVFDDATSGQLASDGRLVFAIETPPEAMTVTETVVGGFGFGRGFAHAPSAWSGGNVLRAYEIADGGAIRWQVPEAKPGDAASPNDSTTWFLGAPLVAGPDLYVLVEEGGEVRVECRRTEDGALRWKQPLASYDERETITNPEARGRRLAGLTPALADGVLVCPLGSGCVVGLDTATRSLLWAHSYARTPADEEGRGRGALLPHGEPCAVIAQGVALLAPYDAPGLVCLHLRDGKPAWPQTKRGRYRIAGIVDSRAVVVSDVMIESIDVATGEQVWKLSLADVGRPSGRGLLTPRSFLLPLDTPEVVEIGLADGRIKGRSPARGDSVPGNLVAHRGEIISRGIDALEVFHQEAALDSRIETAQAKDPSDPWASYWGGQLAIERDDVKGGLERIAKAVESSSLKLPPGRLTESVVRALDRDFAAAASWQTRRSTEALDPEIARMLVDGYLSSGDPSSAWGIFRSLLVQEQPGDAPVVRRTGDPWLVMAADRYVRGRLGRLTAMADASLQRAIDEECRRIVAVALAAPETPARERSLDALADRLGPHPAAEPLRSRAFAAAVEREPLQRAVRRSLAPHRLEAAPADAAMHAQVSWPLGVVTRTRMVSSKPQSDHGRMHPVPLPLAGAGLRGTRAAQAFLDGGQRRLLITDHFGNAVGEPLPVEGVGQELLMPWVNRTSAVEVAVAGRALLVRTRKELVAYDLEAEPGRGRGLWRRPDYAASADPSGDARWPGGVGGRVARDGGVPLGMRISEPEESPRGDGRGMLALPGCLVVPGPRSIALLEPASGRLLWERRRLPPGLEWTVDDDYACGLTNDGFRSIVLDANDGRILHQVDVPHRRQRLATHGRSIVAIRSIDELPGRFTARRVRLELIDPATRQTKSLGEFSGEARATEAAPGRIAIMESGGRLTVLDLEAASVAFHAELPDPPRNFARLVVQPWEDRYLVLAGAAEEGDDADDISPLQQLMLSSPAAAAMSGRLWAVDRDDGQSLWQAPAVLERHCLHTCQPPDLPVLVFCRLIRGPGERDQTWLSLLVVDKRTGHAVLDDDRIAIPSHAFLGCEISGDPAKHTISIAEPAGGVMRLTLTFTGGPLAPQPPYRGTGRLAVPRRVSSLEAVRRVFDQRPPDDGDAIEADPRPFAPEDFE